MIDFHADILPLRDPVFRLALRITLDHHEAEDITQETLIRLWEQRDRWTSIKDIRTYALSICRNMAIDNVRQHHLHLQKEQEILEHQLSVQHDTEPDERLDLIRQLINQLPETQRTIMQLRDIEGLRYDEIAQATGVTETQVKVYLHRARTRIKDFIIQRNNLNLHA